MTVNNPILLTGFEPFADYAVNPSQQIVKRLQASVCGAIDAVVLPVSYATLQSALFARLHSRDWAAVICFGLHGSTGSVRIETLGRNQICSATADNDGVVGAGGLVRMDGEANLAATLPTPVILSALAHANMPAVVSDDAGGYLCNYTLYTVLHDIQRRKADTLAGFIHLPPLPSQKPYGMSMRRQEQVARIVVETVLQHLEQRQSAHLSL